MNTNTRTGDTRTGPRVVTPPNRFTLAAVGRWRYVQVVMRHRTLPKRPAQVGELQELARVLGRGCMGRAKP